MTETKNINPFSLKILSILCSLRAQDLLTIDKINEFKIYLYKSVGKKYLILYFIVVLPI